MKSARKTSYFIGDKEVSFLEWCNYLKGYQKNKFIKKLTGEIKNEFCRTGSV